MSQISDLNAHLFAQLDRLNNPDLKDEALKMETERGKAVAAVSKEVLNNAKLALDVATSYDEMSMNAKRHVDHVLLSKK